MPTAPRTIGAAVPAAMADEVALAAAAEAADVALTPMEWSDVPPVEAESLAEVTTVVVAAAGVVDGEVTTVDATAAVVVGVVTAVVTTTAAVLALVDTTTTELEDVTSVVDSVVDEVVKDGEVVSDEVDADVELDVVAEAVVVIPSAVFAATTTLLSCVCNDESAELRLVASAPVAVAATEESDAMVDSAPASKLDTMELASDEPA